MILNNANNILVGASEADKVYLGSNLIWERDPYERVEYTNIVAYDDFSGRSDAILHNTDTIIGGHTWAVSNTSLSIPRIENATGHWSNEKLMTLSSASNNAYSASIYPSELATATHIQWSAQFRSGTSKTTRLYMKWSSGSGLYVDMDTFGVIRVRRNDDHSLLASKSTGGTTTYSICARIEDDNFYLWNAIGNSEAAWNDIHSNRQPDISFTDPFVGSLSGDRQIYWTSGGSYSASYCWVMEIRTPGV